ncbi:hypothetical protein BDF14DRAFT_1885435 [Spinellus fusiger]|nr:hypothetical protein BDF14DRAFT_1885435 [Spinellus fusiger]
MASRLVQLTLFSSSTCSLCTTAKEAILRVQKKTPFSLSVLDIHREECPKEFADKYIFDVPVLHMNGQFLMQHRIQEEVLLQAIEKCRATPILHPPQEEKPF